MGRFGLSLAVLALAGVLSWAGNATALTPVPPASLPPGIVATVDGAPLTVGTITIGELRRGVSQKAARAGVAPVPGPGEPGFRPFARAALRELLDTAYIEGEAAERNIVVSRLEVAREKAAIKRSAFESRAEYRQFLRESKLSESEVSERVGLNILSRRIEFQVARGIRGVKAIQSAFKEFVAEYLKRWRGRTVCLPRYALRRCSNAPVHAAG